jgi:multiple antibiotic resistance protein
MIFPAEGSSTADAPAGEPFLVPLAVPLIAGPSTLAALLVLQRSALDHTASLLIPLTAAWILSGAILLSSTFYRLLRERGLMAMERRGCSW